MEALTAGWLVAYRPQGSGKAHAAMPGQRTARCGTWVSAPSVSPATPFAPGPSRCASCSRLIEADPAVRVDGAEFTE